MFGTYFYGEVFKAIIKYFGSLLLAFIIGFVLGAWIF